MGEFTFTKFVVYALTSRLAKDWLYHCKYHIRALVGLASLTSPWTVSATPQDNSYPLPPRPYACTTIFPGAISSVSSLAPPWRAGLRPTTSFRTRTEPESSAIFGCVATKARTSLSLTSREGSVSQLFGSLVPPIMVPPSKFRGTQNVQLPSAFCLVTVSWQRLATRQVCPWFPGCQLPHRGPRELT